MVRLVTALDDNVKNRGRNDAGEPVVRPLDRLGDKPEVRSAFANICKAAWLPVQWDERVNTRERDIALKQLADNVEAMLCAGCPNLLRRIVLGQCHWASADKSEQNETSGNRINHLSITEA